MLKGYRTILFNLAMLAVGLYTLIKPGAATLTADDVNSILDHVDSILIIGAPVVNLVLRAVTTTPVFSSGGIADGTGTAAK